MRNFISYFLFCLLVLCSCASNSSDKEKIHGSPLQGKWKIESYADPFKATLGSTSVGPDDVYSLHFYETERFSFTTDCNTISGEYSVKGHDLKFDNISVTELACDKEILERSIKSQLPMVVSYDLPNDSTLCLLGRQGNVMVRLVRVGDKE